MLTNKSCPSVETMRRVRLRNRFLYLLFCCFALTSLLILMSNTQRPAIKTLVTETQKQLSNLKENFRDEKRLKVDKVFLHFLGLTEEPNRVPEIKDVSSENSNSASLSVPWHTLANVTGPVIVTAILDSQFSEVVQFLKSVYALHPESCVILFDMGMSRTDLREVLNICNGSVSDVMNVASNTSKAASLRMSTIHHLDPYHVTQPEGRCHIAPFDSFDLFPSHVRSRAYRPILIQQVLRHVTCCVLWLELNQHLTSLNFNALINRTRLSGGVTAWLRENTMPTSSLTHPKMFEYLVPPSSIEDYNFQHMVALNGLFLMSSPDVIKNLMLPWIQCSLIEECIEPIGAQATGCRFNKKPQFRYSGCHSYDVSALNIILGKMFNFDEKRYISDEVYFANAPDHAEYHDTEIGEDGNVTIKSSSNYISQEDNGYSIRAE